MTVINTAALRSHLRKHPAVNLHGARAGGRGAVKKSGRECSSAALSAWQAPSVLNMARASSPIHYVPKA